MIPDGPSDKPRCVIFNVCRRLFRRRQHQEDPVPYLFKFAEPVLRQYRQEALVNDDKAGSLFRHGLEERLLRIALVQDDERGLSLNRRFSRADYEAKLSLISSNIYKNHVTNTPTGTSASG